jgi:glycosyltransferase involved in cell wall biosynthesis
MVPIVAVRSVLEAGEGIEDFIDAAVLVSWTQPDARFLIVDHGDRDATGRPADLTSRLYRQRILDRIRRVGLHETIRVIDSPINVPRLLGQCNIAVAPSPKEFHARECEEWMAAGVPVVAARSAHATDAITDGENGLLVSPSDPQQLATEIVRLLRAPDLAARVAAAARRSLAPSGGADHHAMAYG